MLYNYYHYPCPEICIISNRNLVPGKQELSIPPFPQSLVTPLLLSFSLDFTALGISCKDNHTIFSYSQTFSARWGLNRVTVYLVHCPLPFLLHVSYIKTEWPPLGPLVWEIFSQIWKVEVETRHLIAWKAYMPGEDPVINTAVLVW